MLLAQRALRAASLRRGIARAFPASAVRPCGVHTGRGSVEASSSFVLEVPAAAVAKVPPYALEAGPAATAAHLLSALELGLDALHRAGNKDRRQAKPSYSYCGVKLEHARAVLPRLCAFAACLRNPVPSVSS